MITSLNPLKSDVFFLLSQINFITFHLNSDIPNILVIHPYYRNTLTGYILGLLDFFLKGFIKRGTYKHELYDNDEEIGSNQLQKYFSAICILGKTKKVQPCCQFIIPECNFDIGHDLNSSIEVISELSKSQTS